jgi:sugar phosphate isomerase/epimerase
MQLGIFAKTFARTNVEDTFAAVQGLGLDCVQFNFSCAGLPTLPESIDAALAQRIWSELEQRSLFMAAISGTCNLIHPDPARREKDLARLEFLLHACPELGTSVVTLCTGTRDPVDMWRAHPENHSAGAWRDLVKALERLLPIAQRLKVALGIEPEPANVIDSAPRARELLNQLKSPHLKIIFDAANLLRSPTLDLQEKILSEAVDVLGLDIVVAHAKDLTRDPLAAHVAAGRGSLDYALYLSLLRQARFDGPLILHSLREDEAPAAVTFLKKYTDALFLARQS